MTQVGEAFRQDSGVVVVETNSMLNRVVSVKPMRDAIGLADWSLEVDDVDPPQLNGVMAVHARLLSR